jgi:undecaprenyl-phosphate 4-deoxy-4-formamido-L-arabinose transferase
MHTISGTSVSVVIPVYGSAGILPQLVEQLEVVLEAHYGWTGFEVILVHDGGPDDAWGVISSLANSRGWVRGIDLQKNAGQHNAIMAGLRYATGSFIVTMDDDLQHSPSDIPMIVNALRADTDLCYAQFGSKRHALWKRLGSGFNDLVARWLLKKPMGLYLSPFRGMTANLRDEILRYEGPFVYVDGLLLQGTQNISTVVAHHHPRADGKSGYSFRKSVSLWMQMATSFSVTPLRFVSLAGLISSGFGFLFAILAVIEKLRSPETPLGWTSLIVVILIASGMQLLALGAIGEYVGRILLTVNHKPQYVVRRMINL